MGATRPYKIYNLVYEIVHLLHNLFILAWLTPPKSVDLLAPGFCEHAFRHLSRNFTHATVSQGNL